MIDRRSFLRLRPTPPAAPQPVPLASPLAPYDQQAGALWGPPQARHLLRRIGASVREDDVQAILNMTPSQAAERLVDVASWRPGLPDPPWIEERRPPQGSSEAELLAWRESNREWTLEVQHGTFERAIGGNEHYRFHRLGEMLREKMTVFWANHFVTELRSHNTAVWLFEYRQVLRHHALRNFRVAVRAIGLTAAMLDYLNGNENRVGAPNENYARELLELFTMGIEDADGNPNYTQDDIAELSRALTGWRTYKSATDEHGTASVVFDPDRFDDGVKTIFGQTGRFRYTSVLALIFQERSGAIAHFIAGKLCRAFVRDEPAPAFVAAVAERLLEEDFDIKPVVKAILASAYFFEPEHVGALIRSPIEVVLGTAYEFGVDALGPVGETGWRRFLVRMREMSYDAFNPPDVRGWEEGRAWIDTGTISARYAASRAEVRQHTQINTPTDNFLTTTLVRPEAGDPGTLTATLCEELLAWTLSDEEIEDLANDHLRNGVSDYYWDPTTQAARVRLRSLLVALVSLPAYQLR